MMELHRTHNRRNTTDRFVECVIGAGFFVAAWALLSLIMGF